AAFVAELDTAFLATVSAADAPYIQHRGGPKGFIKVLAEKTFGLPDYAGNRQYITLSTLPGTVRPHLFLPDFPRHPRTKLWARARRSTRPRIARPPHRPRLSRPPRARDSVHGGGMGRELFPAHHRALHRGRNRGGHSRAAGSDRGAGGGECASARGVSSRAARG